MGEGGTSSPRKESAFLAPKLTWLDGHGACRACRTRTTQGLGGVPSMLLLEAHTMLTWEWT